MSFEMWYLSEADPDAAAVGSSPLPPYVDGGGPLGHGHVSFDRQHLDGGSQFFNIATNGGFTAVTVMRFTDRSGQNWERVFDFGNGASSDNIVLAREGSESKLVFNFYQGSSFCHASISTAIVDGEWLEIVARLSVADSQLELRANDNTVSTSCNKGTDRTLSRTYIGKSNWGSGDTGEAMLAYGG